MTFRITHLDNEPGTLLRVTGELTEEGVPALASNCHGSKFPLTIDLSELTHADKEAAEALSQLSAEGANLTGASPYLSMLLDLTR